MGELCIGGSGVATGYWNREAQTRERFVEVNLTGTPERVYRSGDRWYRTGDIVVEPPDGQLIFVGRRDRMVKRRGYRIELGEIEAGLYKHPMVKEAAVVALKDADGGVRIKAVLSCREGQRPSMIEMKRFCSTALPASMMPDQFTFLDTLPKTSTDKIDYQRLLADVA